MTSTKKSQILTALALLLFVLGCVALLARIQMGSHPLPSQALTDKLVEELEIPEYKETKFNISEAESRPLFSPFRYVEPQKEVVSGRLVEVEPGSFRLVGIIRRGTNSRAAVQTGVGMEPAWVSVGESVSGWILQSIHDDHVFLERGDERQVLYLYPQNNDR